MSASFERPYRPVDLNVSTTKEFPLMSMAEKLMEEAHSATSGRASLTLAHGDEMTLVLVALEAGTTLEDHSAPAAATVITLSGNIIFTTSGQKVTLEQGEAITFTADVLHAVYASEDSVFLIAIGGTGTN
ncbi:cupin domain-containing protein [Candidatus Poribacteria bacterium]|nr:cupin domain-containing protein [Candidatus Poribacteria bacterium]